MRNAWREHALGANSVIVKSEHILSVG